MTYRSRTSTIQQGHGGHISSGERVVSNRTLGKVYNHGDIIIRQGDAGKCMYVIQEGEVEVIRNDNGAAVRLAVLGQGDIFGEISLLGNEKRSASVIAIGEVRVITVDKKVFLQRLQEDATLAFRIFQAMAARIREVNSEFVVLKGAVEGSFSTPQLSGHLHQGQRKAQDLILNSQNRSATRLTFASKLSNGFRLGGWEQRYKNMPAQP